jgi:hypothetical protein
VAGSFRLPGCSAQTHLGRWVASRTLVRSRRLIATQAEPGERWGHPDKDGPVRGGVTHVLRRAWGWAGQRMSVLKGNAQAGVRLLRP